MHTIAVRIDPQAHERACAEVSRAFPARLRELAGGVIKNHVSEILTESNAILITLEVTDVPLAVEIIANLIDKERILGNDLRRGCSIAVKRGEHYEVVFPAGGGIQERFGGPGGVGV